MDIEDVAGLFAAIIRLIGWMLKWTAILGGVMYFYKNI
jgi:hypothetical protein